MALGLTAEDMMAVADFQEELKATRVKKAEATSTGAQIRQEVESEEYKMRVSIKVKVHGTHTLCQGCGSSLAQNVVSIGVYEG